MDTDKKSLINAGEDAWSMRPIWPRLSRCNNGKFSPSWMHERGINFHQLTRIDTDRCYPPAARELQFISRKQTQSFFTLIVSTSNEYTKNLISLEWCLGLYIKKKKKTDQEKQYCIFLPHDLCLHIAVRWLLCSAAAVWLSSPRRTRIRDGSKHHCRRNASLLPPGPSAKQPLNEPDNTGGSVFIINERPMINLLSC